MYIDLFLQASPHLLNPASTCPFQSPSASFPSVPRASPTPHPGYTSPQEVPIARKTPYPYYKNNAAPYAG